VGAAGTAPGERSPRTGLPRIHPSGAPAAAGARRSSVLQRLPGSSAQRGGAEKPKAALGDGVGDVAMRYEAHVELFSVPLRLRSRAGCAEPRGQAGGRDPRALLTPARSWHGGRAAKGAILQRNGVVQPLEMLPV